SALGVTGAGTDGVTHFSSLCEKELRGEVAFTAHSGKTFSDRPVLEAPLCESASAAPRATIRLKGVRSGKPELTVRVGRAGGGAKLNRLKINLPRALRAHRRPAGKGVLVKA